MKRFCTNFLFRKNNILKNPLYRFSTEQRELPSIIKAKYDYSPLEYEEIYSSIYLIQNQHDIINFIQTYGHNLNDTMLYKLLYQIPRKLIDLDQEFEEKVIPVLCHYLTLMDRNHSFAFGIILENLSLLEVRSQQLWQTISKVFFEKNMKKYVPIRYLSSSFINMSNWEQPPQQLMEEMLTTLSLHRLRLNKEEQLQIKEVLQKVPLQLEEEKKLFLEA